VTTSGVQSFCYTEQDLCSDLAAWDDEKPSFVYFTFESLQKILARAKFEYQVLFLFLFDAGIRAPTEMMNVRVEDLQEEPATGKILLNIREDSSKTFGRKIRLMLCCDLLRRYVQVKGLIGKDRLFPMSPSSVNANLERISTEVFGNGLCGLSENNGDKRKLTMYDFRHSSACFYQPRYRSETKIKYRFGWTSSRMIRYYTHFLGMVDTISEEDMALNAEIGRKSLDLTRTLCSPAKLQSSVAPQGFSNAD
jgi:integrase